MKRLGHWLAQAFTENLGLKALALAFAVGLFLYQARQEGGKIQRTFPVGVVVQLPAAEAHLDLMTAIPGTVQITVDGTARQINELVRQGLPPVVVNLRDAQRASLTFAKHMFKLPAGLEFVRVEPRDPIELDWQPVISRPLPVVATVTGTPATGFVVEGEPKVSPPTVYIEGPKSVVDVLQHARATPFDVSRVKNAGEISDYLPLEDPPARCDYRGTGKVLVTVQVEERVVKRSFERGVEVVGVANGKSIPSRVVVTVVGPPEIVEALSAQQVVPLADITAAKAAQGEEQRHGSALVPLQVVLEGARSEIQPPSVTVRW